MFHELYNANDSAERFAEAEAVMVWIDIAAGRSRPMPDWIRNEIQS
jgi:acyl-CoA thioesterase FadM